MEKIKFDKTVESDQIRLQKIYEGNEREFNKLYYECEKLIPIYRGKYPKVDVINIEDAFSKAMYICYANIKSGRLRLLSSRLIDYVSKVMRYKLYDEIEKNPKIEIDPAIPEPTGTEGEDKYIRMRIIVDEYIDMLKEPCKTILEKFYLDGFDYAKILDLLPNFSSLRAIVTRSYKCKKEISEGLASILKENDIDLIKLNAN